MDVNELVQKAKTIICSMSAKEAAEQVVKVCIDEALGEPTREEVKVMYRDGTDYDQDLAEVMRMRKARLLAPKTAEERVTVDHRFGQPGGYAVLLDGEFKFGSPGMSRRDAETYRRGLIAELKEHHS